MAHAACSRLEPRAEVFASYQDFTPIGGVVQHEIGIQATVGPVTPIAEQVVAEEFFVARGSLQKAGGYDLVRIYVLQGKGNAGTGQYVEFLFHLFITIFQ